MDSADQRKDMSQSQIEGLPESQLAIHNQAASTAQECREQALSTDKSTSVDKPALTDASEDISRTSPAKRDESAQTHSKQPGLTRQILSLAIPTLGATIAQPLFLTIDSAMVGHLGAEKIAGMSLAMIVINTVYGMSIFLAYSTTAETAQAMGAGNERRARELGVHAMWLAAIIGITLAGVLALIGTPLLRALGAAEEIMPYASSFLHASLPGLAASLITMAATGVLRGMKDTTTPLIAAGVGALLNVGLNAFLIYGINLGIVGSGIGTSIVSTVMAIALVAILARPARAAGVSLRPSLTGIRQSARVGGPLLARSVAIRLAFLTSIWSATAISVNGLAAYQVVMSAWQIPLFLLDSLAIASQTLVGFAIGSGIARNCAPCFAPSHGGESERASSSARSPLPFPRGSLPSSFPRPSSVTWRSPRSSSMRSSSRTITRIPARRCLDRCRARSFLGKGSIPQPRDPASRAVGIYASSALPK